MTSPYRVVFEKKYIKDLKQIPKKYHASIREEIGFLEDDPRNQRCIKLKGYANLYRVRVGPYRIIYSIHDILVTVYVLEIEHRREVYR